MAFLMLVLPNRRGGDAVERPLAIDLCCGLFGWSEGLAKEGFRIIGFDLEDMCGQFGQPRPEHCQLVVQDILTLHGSQLRSAALIVASPPCQEYSYMAMPWTKAKAKAAAIRADESGSELERLNRLFNACFRIQREACEAAGRHIPLVVENVKGAQKWVGRARVHYGSYYLWGDVPALMPTPYKAVKVPGLNWSSPDKAKRGCFRDSAIKNSGGSWFAISHNTTSGHRRNPDGRKTVGGGSWFGDYQTAKADGIKQHGSGREWFAGDGKISRMTSSKSPARKFASAMIAKIPLALSRHIAKSLYPHESTIL